MDTTKIAQGIAPSTAKLDNHAKRTTTDVMRTVEAVDTQGIWGDQVNTKGRVQVGINPQECLITDQERLKADFYTQDCTIAEKITDGTEMFTQSGKNSKQGESRTDALEIAHADSMNKDRSKAVMKSPEFWQVSIVFEKASAEFVNRDYLFREKYYKVVKQAPGYRENNLGDNKVVKQVPEEREDILVDKGNTHEIQRNESALEKNIREVKVSNFMIVGNGAAAVTKNLARVGEDTKVNREDRAGIESAEDINGNKGRNSTPERAGLAGREIHQGTETIGVGADQVEPGY